MEGGCTPSEPKYIYRQPVQRIPGEKGYVTLMKVIVANYILEGIYFYSGFMFFYNLGRNHKMPGSVQEIRYINRDENTHLWLFRSMIAELRKEEPEMFTPDKVVDILGSMLEEGVAQEMPVGMLCDWR